MFEKMRIKKQIKVIRQRILFLEQKRARSQAALVDAILRKVDPSDEDVEYFNQFTGEIERLRTEMHELEKQLFGDKENGKA
ncbi:MAG: hypothetical protein J5958_07230 [Clostridia bacterium]|nr:hypothetical protein [Clostridia bacterium]